ncbi:MAG: amino acid ABC transporter permease [Clostridia bacterium]|nr:amino acid ABC transporter permease [Clostridia bacterium]
MLELCQSLLGGVKYTLGLFFITAILSLPLGFAMSYLRRSRFALVRGITGVYVWLLRGTPLLLQLFFIYYGLPFIPWIGEYLVLDRFPAACVAFVLNYTAYFCEIFRGGLLSIDKGQYEAARVLGFSTWQTQYKIVIPQMLRVTLPSVSNECITLVKDTALVTAIGVTELLYFAKSAVNREVDATAYAVAAVFYLLMNTVLTQLFRYLEKKYRY